MKLPPFKPFGVRHILEQLAAQVLVKIRAAYGGYNLMCNQVQFTCAYLQGYHDSTLMRRGG